MSEFNDLSSPIRMLETRRSGKPRDMIEPGPSEEELRRILAVAARVPDHGKLAPWRFLVIPKDRRQALNDLLDAAAQEDEPGEDAPKAKANAQFAQQAPTLVVVLSKPVQPHKIPVEEQVASAAAAAMQLENAATALGYVSGWITGWAAYSPGVHKRLCEEDERIAGFLFIGSPGYPLEERPRPDLDDVVSVWD